MSFKKSFHPYAMTTIFFWSLAYVNTRLALKYFSPFAIGFLRYAVAALAMLIVVLVQKIKPPKAKDMIWFALSGATGFFTFATMLNLGLRNGKFINKQCYCCNNTDYDGDTCKNIL